MADALYDSVIADFYDAAASLSGGPVLELGCGTGRMLVPLAQAGLHVTGLDISQRMLERAAEKRARLEAAQHDRVRLVQGDMTLFDLGEQFPLVIIPFRPFQHLLTV